MKNIALNLLQKLRLKKSFGLLALASSALFAIPAQAVDVVYVTSYTGSTVTACPPVCNLGGSYSSFGSTAISAAPGVPSRTKTVYYFGGALSWSIQPTLNVPGAIYQIDVAHTAATASPDIVMTASVSSADGTLSPSCANTPVFNAANGGNTWKLLGYITNAPGITQPLITFTYVSGAAGPASSQNRVYNDAYRFTEINPCSGVSADISVIAPLAENQTSVNVTGVDAASTNISVYADGILIGQRTSGIVAGNNVVTTSGLVANTEIKAIQIKNGCPSSLPGSGPLVGTGANPAVKAFLTFWQSPNYTGPIGTNSAPASSGVYYALKGSGLTGGSQSAPGGGEILMPGQCWQTVTFSHETDTSVILSSGATAFPYDAFAALDGLTFAIGNPNVDGIAGDSGPYDIYVDKIMNGDVVIEDFESYIVGSTNRFSSPNQQPSFPNPISTYLSGSSSSLISSSNVFEGGKALRIQWQWNGTNNIRWARIQANATVGKNYPQIDTTKPITVRYLVLPVGQTTNKLHFPVPPLSQSKTTNETATFNVVTAGEGPFNYQWKFEGNDISGATLSSYTKSNVQLVDAGTYSVTVTGAGGSGCNATVEAELAVTEFVAPPTITYTWNGSALQLNWTGTFNLESKTNLSEATWTSVGVSTGPYNVPLTGSATFYRLHNP